ncbi:MAG TPA: hypothetical protein VF933_27195 [Streptosporangiaceae bacterium]
MTSIIPATRSAAGLRLLAHHDLGGHGDGMQVLREGDALYVGHTGPPTRRESRNMSFPMRTGNGSYSAGLRAQ